MLGNNNAYTGGRPQPRGRLTRRQMVQNIQQNMRGKELSADQKARRAAVAKRLRAQARREEAAQNTQPLEGNEKAVSEAKNQSPKKLGSVKNAKPAKVEKLPAKSKASPNGNPTKKVPRTKREMADSYSDKIAGQGAYSSGKNAQIEALTKDYQAGKISAQQLADKASRVRQDTGLVWI